MERFMLLATASHVARRGDEHASDDQRWFAETRQAAARRRPEDQRHMAGENVPARRQRRTRAVLADDVPPPSLTEQSKARERPSMTLGRCYLLHDPFTDGEADDLGGVVEVELLHDVLAVTLDGVDAEREDAGDLFVGLALGDELQDLALASREPRQRVLGGAAARVAEIAVEQDLRDRRAEVRAAARERLHRLDEVEVLGVLQEIALGPGLQRLAHVDVVGVHREDEHTHAVGALHDLVRRLDAVQARQTDVDDDDGGAQPLRGFDRAAAVAHLATDLDLGVRLENLAQALAYHGVVLGEQHANLAHAVVSFQVTKSESTKPTTNASASQKNRSDGDRSSARPTRVSTSSSRTP